MALRRFLVLLLAAGLVLAGYQHAEASRHPKHKKKRQTKAERIALSAHADSLGRNIVIAYPLSFFSSGIKLGYERVFGANKGIQVQLSYADTDSSEFYGMRTVREISGEIQYKIYSARQVWDNSFYMGPFITFRALTGVADISEVDKSTGTTHYKYNVALRSATVCPGYLVGYQKVFNEIITINMFLGAGLNLPSGDYKNVQAGLGLYNKGIQPHFGLGIGFFF